MKREFVIIGVLFVGTTLGAGFAILQNTTLLPMLYTHIINPEEKYTTIRGMVRSFNDEDILRIAAASTSTAATEEYRIRITPRTKLLPFDFVETEDDTFGESTIYPLELGDKKSIQENTWITALVYESDPVPIAVELYYEKASTRTRPAQ